MMVGKYNRDDFISDTLPELEREKMTDKQRKSGKRSRIETFSEHRNFAISRRETSTVRTDGGKRAAPGFKIIS
jgi:hypothetical protein